MNEVVAPGTSGIRAADRRDRPLRIGLLSAWCSRLGGGVFEAVVAHSRLLAALGHEARLFALADARSGEDRGRLAGIEVIAAPVRGPRAIGYAPALLPALLAADLDVVHLHGIWMYPSLAGARWTAATGRPYLISPHGMLDPWILARGRAKKALARAGYERRSWRAATRLHALTGAEAADIARATGRDPAAIDIVPNAVAPSPSASAHPAEPPFLLSLGRIHPKKNVDALIDGWLASQGPARGWSLVIAGWGEPDHVAALAARLARLAHPAIRFVGPAYGAEKARLLATARFLVLPSFSEGLPMAILEAWAARTPTIMSAGCNLPEGVAAGAAIETGTDPAAIAAALDRGIALAPAGHAAMAAAAARLAAEMFAPDRVADRWRSVYEGLTAAR